MNFIFTFSISALLWVSVALGEARLPLSSYRSQGDTAHCWAYAAAHMLESRAQYVTGNSATINIEADLMYWVYADRLFERYRLKEEIPIVGMDDGKLKSEEGIPQEFFKAFLNHGQSIHSVKEKGVSAAYPKKAAEFIPFERPDGKRLTARDEISFIRKLDRARTDSEARDLISEYLGDSHFQLTLDLTEWLGTMIGLGEVPRHMFGDHMADLERDELVWVEIEKRKNDAIHKWEPIGFGGYLSYAILEAEADELARLSLDRGWPVISVGQGHMWAVVGYNSRSFYHADSGDPKMYRHPSSKGTIGGESLIMMKSVLEEKFGRGSLDPMVVPTRKFHTFQ